MSEYRVASRYAKSLLELADEKGVLEPVLEDMQQFSKLCAESREFVLMLKNPIIKHDKKNMILKKVFEGNAHELTLAIFDIITKKNRESILPGIAREFQNQYKVQQGIEEAKVTTAVPLSPELKKSLEEVVLKISSKKKVELVESVDKELIGGFILKVGDRQIDDSLKSKLKALELKFSQNPYIKEF
ncbi:ATP synthase F1 subunit delta [Fulvivirga sp. RKSG066]|uniref:ATP synthase F1 subunit delta n=1 Tax=Fulvivirga aurantia TaxID=2529383 RepID=UPI0012BC6B4B|nr:ATP synthase F1 subunit delta [Fulvivirga aurantia]MTI20146.1 ATP synthase F1 subunit delta [Fulvivirga aurantia]